MIPLLLGAWLELRHQGLSLLAGVDQLTVFFLGGPILCLAAFIDIGHGEVRQEKAVTGRVHDMRIR
jgi:hypothetical protein